MDLDDRGKETPGDLYLVATPVGNLGDITLRAIETLKSADIIAAEDTRHTRTLLDRHDIKPKRRLEPYHAHNIERATSTLIKEMLKGKTVALVSDAGSPGISDPGAALVKAAIKENVAVIPIPGATAPILAVAASGFPSNRFIFEGFLPRKKGRKAMFESWREERRTILFFESPKRIVKTLQKILEIIGPRKICIARELTKKFEEFIRGEIDEVISELESRHSVKGEITVVVAPEGFDRD